VASSYRVLKIGCKLIFFRNDETMRKISPLLKRYFSVTSVLMMLLKGVCATEQNELYIQYQSPNARQCTRNEAILKEHQVPTTHNTQCGKV